MKIGFSKFCTLSPKSCVIAGSSGTHSVYVCTTHRNTIFLVEELYDINPDFKFHHSQWETTDRASLVTVTSTCEEYNDTLISTINAITKHLVSAKCQANFLRAKKESLKANEVNVLEDLTKNYPFLVQDETQNYNWSKEYCTLHPFVVYFIDGDGNIHHNSLCFISDNKSHDTIFFIKYKQSLLITLKKTFQLWIRSYISLTAVLNNITITKTLLICIISSKISI